MTLDDYCSSQGIDRIDVVKVDVEGSEAKVLEGGRRLLAARAIRLLIVEFNESYSSPSGGSPQAMVEWLDEYGMTLRGSVGDDVAFAPVE